MGSVELELILCDTNVEVCRAWRRAFRRMEVSIECGDMFDVEADAYVSPANSYGIMDGGFDVLLNRRFPGIGERVRSRILGLGGLLPVGQAIVVETDDPYVPFLVCAPTMYEPTVVAQTSNVTKAMSGVLASVRVFNERSGGGISSLVVPGLGTGIGRVPMDDAAEQMAMAYREFLDSS